MKGWWLSGIDNSDVTNLWRTYCFVTYKLSCLSMLIDMKLQLPDYIWHITSQVC